MTTPPVTDPDKTRQKWALKKCGQGTAFSQRLLVETLLCGDQTSSGHHISSPHNGCE